MIYRRQSLRLIKCRWALDSSGKYSRRLPEPPSSLTARRFTHGDSYPIHNPIKVSNHLVTTGYHGIHPELLVYSCP